MTDQDVPLWRLNLLRAFYLLITVGLAIGHNYVNKPGSRWR